MDLIKSVADHTGINQDKYFKNTLYKSDALLLGLNCLAPGQVQGVHSHSDQDKFYFVVEGTGCFLLGDAQREAAAGDVVWAPAALSHGVENKGDGPLILLVGIAPAP